MVVPSTQIDLRHNPPLVGVIEVPWIDIYSKAKQARHEKMLLKRKHVSDSERFIKETDFREGFDPPTQCAEMI